MAEEDKQEEKFDFTSSGEALATSLCPSPVHRHANGVRGAWQLRADLANSPDGVRGSRRGGNARRLLPDPILPP